MTDPGLVRRQFDGGGWRWEDITIISADAVVPQDLQGAWDPLGLSDAFFDLDLPKVDDFGDHLLIVLHGLRDDDVETYEVDCFVAKDRLLTVRSGRSLAIDALWTQMERTPGLVPDAPGEVAAALADLLTRRLLGVTDAFELQSEELIGRALSADPDLLGDIAAIRSDLANARRVLMPQREVLDQLRTVRTPLFDDHTRRRFADVFDVASRATQDLDSARSATSEVIEAYRGAEARKATEVNRVLTIYAAIMLPLTLIAGFFGMNHEGLPTIDEDHGWIVVLSVMIGVAALSLGVFVAVGWIRRPSARVAATTLGKGLIEAARTPIDAVLALRPVRGDRRRRGRANDRDEG